MTMDQWERRFACALGMAIYIHLTANIWYGLFSLLGITMCMGFAWIPAIQKWADERAARQRGDQ